MLPRCPQAPWGMVTETGPVTTKSSSTSKPACRECNHPQEGERAAPAERDKPQQVQQASRTFA